MTDFGNHSRLPARITWPLQGGTIVVGIVAHINRTVMAEQLADQTDAVVISYDDGTLGATLNHINTWKRLADEPADWAVVLEDDAVPVHDFTTQLEQALAVAPTPIVSLYLGRQRPPQFQHLIPPATATATERGAHWLVSRHLLHAVGVAIRTDLIGDMLTHLNSGDPIETGITDWLNHHYQRVAYTWPSLVDHADAETLIHHPDGELRPPGRVAWETGSRDHWNNITVDMN